MHENRHYIKTIGEVLLLTATQDVAQCGHREASIDGNANTGTFLQILQLVARHDEIVMKKILLQKMQNTPVTKYKMRLLTFLVDLCDSLILDEVRDAEYFSIIVDETKNISKTEMISIILRYYSCQNSIQEAFLEYRPAVGLTADSLSKIILKFIQDCGLNLNKLVGQGHRRTRQGGGRPPGLEKFQGKLCFQGNRKFLKNPE